VLDSARDLVCQLGPRAVTVDKIAAAAGVGKQTIYRWWPSKSSVIMDALIELTDPDPTDLPDSTYEAVRLQMRRTPLCPHPPYAGERVIVAIPEGIAPSRVLPPQAIPATPKDPLPL